MEGAERSYLWINLAAIVVVIAGLREAGPILVPFLFAAFLAVISFPAVEWLTARRVPLAAAVSLVLLVAILLLGGLGVVVSQSVRSFTANLPLYEARLTEQIALGRVWLEGTGFQVPIPTTDDLIGSAAIFSATSSLVAGLGMLLTNVLLSLLSYVFMLFEAPSLPAKLRRAFGSDSNTLADLDAMAGKMKHYLALKAVVSLGTGIPVWLFLALMGIDYPVLWGLLAFLLNFIPNIGSVIAAVPPMLLAVIQYGPLSALGVGVFFFLMNTVMGNIVEPKIMGQGLGLSTFVVFAALVFWGWVLGAVGMFLAVPLTIMAQIVLASHRETRSVAILMGGEIVENLHLAEAEPAATPVA
ncbi:MAG: AI-2E family transporter [Bryobacterales bacterium]|nr:AI-2E family transporter [Bryobacterales bacterium]